MTFKDNDYEGRCTLLEWLSGEEDCKEGYPPKEGATEGYRMGYSYRYELEQIMSWFSDVNNNKRGGSI